MALQFTIPKGNEPKSTQTLISGFGLPLVQRALIGNINEQPSDPSTLSKLGTPVFDYIFIQKPEYYDYEYDEVLKAYTKIANILASNYSMNGKDGFYCEGVVIEANMPRNIVTTQVSGYDKGSVVEFINNGDFNITIRGFVSTPYPDKYPLVDAQIIANYCRAPLPLTITSNFINKVLGVNDIVVMGFNMFQNQGLRNVQYFEINCISNIPYTITNNAQATK